MSSTNPFGAARFRQHVKVGPYWFALIASLFGLLLRFLIDPWLGNGMPYVTFLVVVAITGLYAGVRPAMLSAALGAGLAYFFFVPPRHQWGFGGISDAVGFLAYVAAALAIVVLTHARTTAYEQAARILEERVHAERKLRDAQKLLQLFMDNRPGCAYLRDQTGAFVYCNNEARVLLGITNGITDRTSESFLKLDSQDQEVMASPDSTFQFIDKMSFGEEDRYWLTTKFILVGEEQRKFIGSLSIDITDQMRAEQVVLESARLAAASQMVGMVAHEINNPLEALTNSLFLLGREPLPMRAREFVEIAQEEISRVVRISRLALGFYMETELPVSLDPCGIVDDVVNIVAAQFPANQVQIQSDYKCRGGFVACGGHIQQIVHNVVTNSFESGASRIRLRVTRSKDWGPTTRSGLRISILDNGHGMSPKHFENAFQPFFSTKKEKGVGLGLWITKAIVLRHGGRIAMRSTDSPERHGTCISIFLPDHMVAAPSAGTHTDSSEFLTRPLSVGGHESQGTRVQVPMAF